jgi:ActR/RegA family two-component response regulator
LELVKAAKVERPDGLVLIVDDDADLRAMVVNSLQREGITCITADSAEQATTALNNNPVALMLLDWGLKGKYDTSGVQVLDYCKEQHPTVPVIVMSGQEFDVRTDAITRQADGFLQKPLSATVITNLVTQWLNRIRSVPKVFLPRTVEEVLPLDDIKVLYIRHVLELVGYNISLAAEKLGIHRQTVAAALKGRTPEQ